MDIDDFLDKEQQEKKKSSESKQGNESNAEEDSHAPVHHGDDPLVYIEEINRLMTEKQYEKAERMYITAKEKFSELTRRQMEEHDRIYRALEKINREMVSQLNNQRMEARKKVGIILQLIEKLKLHINKNELVMSNQLYTEIDNIFKQLPDSLPEEKVRIEQTIASLHVMLASKNHNASSIDFQSKWNEIGVLLKHANDLIGKNEMTEAARMYHKINNLYEQLPKGFLYEKAVLYEKILKLFKAVHHTRHQVSPDGLSMPENAGGN